MAKKFDHILDDVGSFGRYQKKLISLVLLPISCYGSFYHSSLIFQTTLPDEYWCDVKGRELTNFTIDEWKNLTIPRTTYNDFEKCLRYETRPQDDYFVMENERSIIACDSGFDHNRMVYKETVGTEHGWFCDKTLYSSHLFSVNTAGCAVGTFILPIIADHVTGRRLMFYIAMGIHLVFTLLFAIVPNYPLMLLTRFGDGLSYQTYYQMCYVIVFELLSPEKRVLVNLFNYLASGLGVSLAAVFAWVYPHWRYLNWIIATPAAASFVFWRILPESPRWLLSKGKIYECCNILLKISKENGRTDIARECIEVKIKELSVPQDSASIKDIFNYPILCRRFIFLILCSAFNYLAFSCILINVNIVPWNPFLSVFVLGIIQCPSSILSGISAHYFGRRFTNFSLATWYVVCSFLATFFLDESSSSILLCIVAILFMLSIQGVSNLSILVSELMPTPFRATCYGFVAVSGMMLASFAPYIVNSSIPGLQYYIMMVLYSLYFLCSIPLPETMGLPLPQTFQEANELARNRPLFRWVNYWNFQEWDLKTSEEISKDKEEHEDHSINNLTVYVIPTSEMTKF